MILPALLRPASYHTQSRELLSLEVINYTYGGPRVGNHRWARHFNEIVPDTFRLVCDRDVITGMPKFGWLFKHVGQEVIIDLYGNLLAHPTVVDKMFRRGKDSLADHSLVSYMRALAAVVEARHET